MQVDTTVHKVIEVVNQKRTFRVRITESGIITISRASNDSRGFAVKEGVTDATAIIETPFVTVLQLE